MRATGMLVTLTALLAAGCATEVTMQTSVPVPLVENTGIPIYLQMDEPFRSAGYEEEKEERLSLSIDLGTANTQLVERVFRALGRVTVMQPGATEPPPGGALKVTPEFLALQYSVPAENNAGIYEVWLKYRFVVSDSTGSVLADWQLNGYGKVAQTRLPGHQATIERATEIALRDVGAQLAIGFGEQPAIVEWRNRTASTGS